MSQKPVTMDYIKQIYQLRKDGVPIKEIVRRVGISRNSVRKYIQKLGDSCAEHGTKELAELAYGNEQAEQHTGRLQALFLFFTHATKELSKTGVTRQLLWHEYLRQHPGGYGYSQFCYVSPR